MKLTKSFIDKAEYVGNGTNKYVVWDDDVTTFGLRISPRGRKTFVLRYWLHGRGREITLGRYGHLTVEQGRRMAKVKIGLVMNGEDPLATRREEALRGTVAELADAFMIRYAKPHRRSWKIDEGRLQKHILPQLKNIPVRALGVADLSRLHLKIGETRPTEANRVIELLRVMLEKAKVWGFLAADAPNVAKQIDRFKEQSRDRYLTPEELPRVTAAIQQESNPYIRGIIWMYLLTGCRKSELLSAKWEHVDLHRAELKIPETKNGSVFYVSLSSAALAILRAIPRQAGNPYIFCGHVTGAALVNIAKPWNRIRLEAEVPDVTLHDLRRTVGSWLAQSGASLHLIAHVLNHSSTEATRVYARFAPSTTRDLLEQHGAKLLQIANLESTCGEAR